MPSSPSRRRPLQRVPGALGLVGALLAPALLTAVLPASAALAAAEAAPSRAHTASALRSHPVAVPGRRAELRLEDAPKPVRAPRGSSLATASDGTRALLVAAPVVTAAKSTWEVTYTGFDAYPAAKAAFQSAVDIWATQFASRVPVRVNANFASLGSGILGSAGATYDYSYDDGLGRAYYSSAIIDSIAGYDVGASSSDITASFTNQPVGFYFGTDGAPASNQIDFKTVVLHELGHGLGFAGGMDVSGTLGSYTSPPYRFDRYTYDAPAGGSRLLSYSNGSLALALALQGSNVHWDGPNAKTANGGVRPKMYAPAIWESGSSYSHLDETTYGFGNPNSLMTPSISYQEAIHSPGPLALGIYADIGALTTSAPGAPTGVTAAAGNGSATVSWTASTSNGGSPVTGHTVTSTPAGGTGSCTTATSCTVTGLSNGTSYVFRVVATNAAGSSLASTASTAVVPSSTPSVLTVPDAPTAVTATAGGASAVVSWTAPSSTGGSALTGYSVTSSPAGGTSSCTTTTSCLVSGLVNGTAYVFTVTASNAVGTGPASAPSAAVTPATVPGSPTGVTAMPQNASAVVSWTAPASDGGSPVTGYRIASSPAGGTSTCGTGTSCTVSGLSNGTSYAFTVVAINVRGTSPSSSPSPAVVPLDTSVRAIAPPPLRLPGVTRFAGADRYSTAVAVSRGSFPGTAEDVFIVTGANWPDALSAGPAAASVDAPVLPVTAAAVPSVVGVELDRLDPVRAWIIGGTGAVSDAVAADLAARGISVRRLSGADRYASAAAVAARFFPSAAGAYYASGATYADALGGGAAAARRGWPLLLTARDAVPASTPVLGSSRIVLGGTAAVSETVRATLGARRVSGTDRYATAAAIARDAFPLATVAYLATGANFPDALAGTPAAARDGAPLLLTAKSCITSSTSNALLLLGATSRVVLGGTAAVSDAAASLVLC